MTVQPNTTQFIPSVIRSHSIHGIYLFTGWWLSLNGRDLKYFCSMAKKGACHWDGTFLNLVLTRRPCSDKKWRGECSSVLHGTTPQIWNMNFEYFERSNNLLMAGGIFLCLNQVMLTWLRRHQGLVLEHCKNEHRHRYTKTKQIPGSLHLQWARGEEDSWSA